MAADFYTRLAPISRFRDVSNLDAYTPAPDDWLVVLTDVRGSTRAISEGRYKQVNIVGAAAIVALLNLDREIELPYIFGGDGATILIPPKLAADARRVLPALSDMAATEFQLELRTAIVPVSAIADSSYAVLVAKIRFSEQFSQAAFTGGGLTYIEKLVKDPERGAPFLLPRTVTTPADLNGLECRWKDIPSPYGETLTLLVVATSGTARLDSQIYQDVIDQIEAIYGATEKARPIQTSTLFPTFSLHKLMPETRLRTPRTLLNLKRRFYLWKIWLLNWLLLYLWRNHIQMGGVQWDQYVELLVETSDYRKYDDTLRMVITGTPRQREQLHRYLHQRHQRGELAYGLHVSDRALVTCAVFERMGRQVHFIDGADGGYALAARELKRQLREAGPLAASAS